MQENLALTLSTTNTLTSEETDLVEGTTYTPLRDTATQSSATPSANYEASWRVVSGGLERWYYQYSTAVAGTWKGTGDDQIAPSSICPKNWKLPLSGSKYNNTSGSFYNLFTKYGFSSSSDTVLMSAPLNFSRSGEIWVNGIQSVNATGVYHSSVVQKASSYSSYILYFRNNSVVPTQAQAMGGGDSVRCLSYGQ